MPLYKVSNSSPGDCEGHLGEEGDLQLLLVPHLGLCDVTRAPGRVAEPGIGPGFDGPVFQFERDPQDGLVEEGGLLEVAFVVVSRAEVAVGPSLFDPVAQGSRELEVVHVALDGPVEVAHGQVNGADVADLARLLFKK